MFIQKEDALRREQNLEDAKKIVLEQDAALPAAKLVGAFRRLGFRE